MEYAFDMTGSGNGDSCGSGNDASCQSTNSTPSSYDDPSNPTATDREATTDDCNVDDISVDAVLLNVFGTVDDAENWYKKYARLVGFGVRRDRFGRNVKGEVLWRSWVCDREGFRAPSNLLNFQRKKRQRDETRCGCGAYFRVRFNTETLKWHVDKFEDQHSHNVVGRKYSHLFRSHRALSNADVSQANSMRSCGITTAHIMGFMVRAAGGHASCGFVRKDLYNHFDRERRARICDGDVVAALCYLQAKADTDPMTFVRYTTDSDNRLQHLFWCDGQSRVDFHCFHDVLSFDTTYKKNLYNKPLVIFSGVNNHNQNIVFAAAILADETEITYKWVLQTFTDAMEGRNPCAVVTDGDKAMRKAIKVVFPAAVHRLCSWHLARNACSNVSNIYFQQAFSACMYVNCGIEEFEQKWTNMLEEFNLAENAWVKKTYKKCKLWATAYLRDKFFAGIRTTSRCESLNGFIAGFVRGHDTLVDMLHHFERGLMELRNNEFVEDFKCLSSEPVLDSPLRVLEHEAAQIYTRKAFLVFHDQVLRSADLTLLHRSGLLTHVIYRIGKFLDKKAVWQVLYDTDRQTLTCDCHFHQHHGIPCCHILCVMKHEHVAHIPQALICKRWTRDARNAATTSTSPVETAEAMQWLRYGSLSSSCNWMSHLACQDVGDYNEIRQKVADLIDTLEGRQRARLAGRAPAAPPLVSDPVNTRTKGRPLQPKGGGVRQNKCSICKVVGHNRSTCPQLWKNPVLRSTEIESQASQPTEERHSSLGHGGVTSQTNLDDVRRGVHSSSAMHASQTADNHPSIVRRSRLPPWMGTQSHWDDDSLNTESRFGVPSSLGSPF